MPFSKFYLLWTNAFLSLMKCKNQNGRSTDDPSDGRPEMRKIMKTTGEHRWGAGQSSSDAFVRDLGRMINRKVKVFTLIIFIPCVFLFEGLYRCSRK